LPSSLSRAHEFPPLFVGRLLYQAHPQPPFLQPGPFVLLSPRLSKCSRNFCPPKSFLRVTARRLSSPPSTKLSQVSVLIQSRNHYLLALHSPFSLVPFPTLPDRNAADKKMNTTFNDEQVARIIAFFLKVFLMVVISCLSLFF